MAGRDYADNITDGKLVDLDLTGANIVEGGDHEFPNLKLKIIHRYEYYT